MPFLDLPFKHDVFVSCHPGQDLRLIDWTTYLVEQIKNEVKSDATEMVAYSHLLGMDETGEQPLISSFENSPGSSGVILIILTEQFLNSPWCVEEAHWFEQQLKENQRQGGRSIVLVCDPTLEARMPRSFGGLPKPVSFFSSTDNSGRHSDPKPLGFPHPVENDRAFWMEVSSLATLVINHLRKIKADSSLLSRHREQSTISTPLESLKVYLNAKSSHIDAWETVKGQLEDAGCAVFPEKLSPVGNDLVQMEMAREERLRILKEEANAACALVVDPPTEHDIHLLVSDRTALRVSGKNIPCALIDQTGSENSLAQRLGIQTVHTVQQDWTNSFQSWLKNTIQTG